MLPFYGGSSGGISSLNALTGATQTFVNDTNMTMVSSGTTHTLTWSGTLSASRGGTGISALGTGVATALGVNVGSSGAFVVLAGALGTPSSGTLTSCTGLPISTGVSGLGTGVATALGTNIGSSGAFVVLAGALGTPSSGNLSNCTFTDGTNWLLKWQSGNSDVGLRNAADSGYRNFECASIWVNGSIATQVSSAVGAGALYSPTGGYVCMAAPNAISASTWGFLSASAGLVGWASSTTACTTPDTAMVRRGAAVAGISNGSTGGGILEFLQVAAGGTCTTNSARIYALDVAGNAEMHVKDEAGTETQISPHAMDGAATLYDNDDPHPMVVKDVQHYLGGVRYVNVSRTAKLLEDLLKAIAAGNTLTQIRTFLNNRGAGYIDCYRVESFAQHNARLGTSLTTLNWQTVQNQHQANYDAARAAEIVARDAWLALPVDQRSGTEPTVRPVADIRKPKPAWLAARGA